MRALAEPGERGREHFVTALLQQVGDAPIAPAAGGGAVHENEGLAVGLHLRGCRRRAHGGSCQSGSEPSDQLAAARRTLRLVHHALPHMSAAAPSSQCQSRLLAIFAPSASAWNFAHTMLACTSFEPAKVAKPQSAPAMTFSRPTTAA